MNPNRYAWLVLAIICLLSACRCNRCAPIPFAQIHDTISAPILCDTTKMPDSLKGRPYMEPKWHPGYANSMQYRIWEQRNKKMKQWEQQYSYIPLLPNAHIIDEQSF